jgi:hypothetical protein
MDGRTVEIKGNEYAIGKLGARDQFHVARRISPIIIELRKDDMASLLLALSRMSDEDTNYVLDRCLAVCRRKNVGGGWDSLMAVQGNKFIPAFSDIDGRTELELAGNVIEANELGSFFLTSSPQPATGTAVK